MDNSPTYNILSLCSGVGGLELGVRIAREQTRLVCAVEVEAHACEVLAARMESGEIDPAPIWSDVATFDGAAWRGVVDCVVSGDPCQPNSVAGGMLGADDDRWLLDKILAVVEGVRPARFFRENVTGNADGQLAAIVPALERMGYRVAAGIFSAEEVGFSHRRERLFIMADRGCDRGAAGLSAQAGRAGVAAESEVADDRGDGKPVAHADRPRRKATGRRRAELDAARELKARGDAMGLAEGVGRGEGFAEPSVRGRGRDTSGGSGGAMGNAGRGRSGSGRRDDGEGAEIPAGEGTEHGAPVHRGTGGTVLGTMGDADRGPDEREAPSEVGGPQRRTAADGAGAGGFEWLPLAAPGPADPRWADIIAHAPHLEPAVRRVDARLAYRVDRLRECGNGVTSLAAALAWCALEATLAQCRD